MSSPRVGPTEVNAVLIVFMVVTCLFSHESVVFGSCNWLGSDVGSDIGGVAGSYFIHPPSSQRNRSLHLVLPHCPDPLRNSLFD
jgi:hypothetical protein